VPTTVRAGRPPRAATPQETVVLEILRQVGLELHVIFNREAVMVPDGVNARVGRGRIAYCNRRSFPRTGSGGERCACTMRSVPAIPV
jgi:hypothetical protein